MKKTVINIFAMTGITLVALSLIAYFYNATFLCLDTVFQALGVNVLIYAGITLINKVEINLSLIETGLKIIYAVILVLIFGNIFAWYESLPTPVLIIFTVFVLAVCELLDMLSLKNKVKEINDLIRNDL
ncbi:MAG: hypothetical protein J6X94_02495 [Lachnospiraceae bacterium]|nr:hypothetical protein [Lachnospiraceae bacterium]